MTILVLAGIAATSFTIPVAIAVLVVVSYSQVIKGYPVVEGATLWQARTWAAYPASSPPPP